MMTVLLTILKILGIILLVILGIVLLVLLLVLFVPVRYRLDAHRDLQEESPVVAAVKATWLLRLLGVCFSYPDAAYVKVKVLGITVYRSDKEPKPKKENEANRKDKKEEIEKKEAVQQESESTAKEKAENTACEKTEAEETDIIKEDANCSQETENSDDKPSVKEFFLQLWDKIKNIKYTITQICDKMKHIIKNIRYYLKVIQSDTFQNAFSLCSAQLFSLLKSISPRKIKGEITIGTGEPASTGQVLAIYGMLYPLLGSHISVTPDFERQIVEGNLLVKGKITFFKAVKTAMVLFFNKDVRRLSKLLKREVK